MKTLDDARAFLRSRGFEVRDDLEGYPGREYISIWVRAHRGPPHPSAADRFWLLDRDMCWSLIPESDGGWCVPTEGEAVHVASLPDALNFLLAYVEFWYEPNSQ